MEAKQNRLTDFEFTKGNIWLKHTFIKAVNDELDDIYSWDFDRSDWEMEREDFEQMFKVLSERSWDDIDALLNNLAVIKYSNKVLGKLNGGELIEFTAEQIARILVNWCFNVGAYWDDKSHTKFEKEYFEKTILGKAVKDLDCYLTPEESTKSDGSTTASVSDANVSTDATTATASTTTQTPSQAQTASTKSGSGSHDPYKARGPLSGQARGLVGQPNQKMVINKCPVYKIVDDGLRGKEVRAIVRPLHPNFDDGAGNNKVIITNANNRGDLVCLFTDFNAAKEFRDRAQVDYTNSPNNTHNGTLMLKQARWDPNGYFKVRTVYGDCLVLASALNEEVTVSQIENTESIKPYDHYKIRELTQEELQYYKDYNMD